MNAFACGIALFAFCPLPSAHSEPSPAVCTEYANNYAQHNNNRGQLIGGAAGGSAIGAGVGLIFGGAGAGAAIGAGLGTISGGGRKSESRRLLFDDAFIECMAGRIK